MPSITINYSPQEREVIGAYARHLGYSGWRKVSALTRSGKSWDDAVRKIAGEQKRIALKKELLDIKERYEPAPKAAREHSRNIWSYLRKLFRLC